MNDPRVLAVISLVFTLLGLYSISNGWRRLRAARLAGSSIRWYKQINILTGIEYLLLTCVFILSLANQPGTPTSGLHVFIVPLYFLLLLISAVIAAIVIRQGLLNARASRATARNMAPGKETRPAPELEAVDTPPASARESGEEQAQRQRERRKKAAAARRRRGGRA
ncbi:MAG: hypothetical protein ACRDHW_13605 [Ktedonobacteraceae bacterium]